MLTAASRAEEKARQHKFWTGILRGFGGALLFSLPMLLTMELWWLGFYAYRWRLVLMLVIMIPVLIGLAHYAGIRSASNWRQDVIDGMAAYGIGLVTVAMTLPLLGLITLEMPLRDIVGKIMIQSPTSAFGAVVARSQLGGGRQRSRRQHKQRSGYWGELFFVAAGAFYLGSTVAATAEMIMIPFKMTAWHALALLVAEVLITHAFLYSMKFAGAPEVSKSTPWWSLLIRLTMPGYVVALAVSAWVLWTLGRFESFEPHWILMFTLVLGLPCAVGGAAGRLIL